MLYIYFTPGIFPLTSWLKGSSIPARGDLRIVVNVIIFLGPWLLEKCLGSFWEPSKLPSTPHTAASSKRYSVQSTPPSGTGTIPATLPGFPANYGEERASSSHSTLFLPQNSWAEKGNGAFWKGVCGPSTMTCWRLARSAESQNLPSHSGQMAFIQEGKAQQYQISNPFFFICMFIL